MFNVFDSAIDRADIMPDLRKQVLERDAKRRLSLRSKENITATEAAELCAIEQFYGLIPNGVAGVIYGRHGISLK